VARDFWRQSQDIYLVADNKNNILSTLNVFSTSKYAHIYKLTNLVLTYLKHPGCLQKPTEI